MADGKPLRVEPPVLTFDLEEWFHLLECEAIPGESGWASFPSRIESNTDRILSLLNKHGLRATFFSLGWVARTYPTLLRRITQEGHELGCHSDVHTLVWSQTPEMFRQDTTRAMGSISDAIGKPVLYYRAPGFSITTQCLWAFNILLELGITVDCSIYPGSHAHGGTRTLFPGTPFRFETSGKTLQEYPVSLAGPGPLKIAFVGGGYFRLLPLPIISRYTLRYPGAMTYFHPRDLDPGQPRIPGLSVFRHFKSHIGLKGAEVKLDRFLSTFGGQPLGQATDAIAWQKTPVISI